MKKFMKSIIATTMVIAMSATLVGCGGSDSGEADVLTMGTNAEFPPYEFYEGQEIVGIDVEIAGAIAEKLGKELVVEDMAFDAVILAISGGKIDIGMAGMTVTPDRLESVDFSDSYATGVQAVIVKEGSPITTVDDLFIAGSDNIVGVQTGTTGDIYASDDIEKDGFGTIERYSKGADAVQSLATGKIDCVIIDNEPAKQFVKAIDGLVILETEYAVEDYAIAIAKDSPLTDEINVALQELIADGTVQGIIDKYITAE